MKKLFIIAPLMLALLMVSSGFTVMQDAKADKILRDSKAKFESLKDFSANFVYSITNEASKNKRSIVKEGTLKIKGDKFVLTLDDQEIYCDGTNQWIYNKMDQEVNILPYDPEESLNIESIFQVYEANGKSRYEGEEKIGNVKHHRVYLAISDPSLDYNQATLWISEATKLPSKAVIKDRNQTVTEVKFSNVKINQNFPDSDFVFDTGKYPDVEVYDER